jgi:hypothetical protein
MNVLRQDTLNISLGNMTLRNAKPIDLISMNCHTSLKTNLLLIIHNTIIYIYIGLFNTYLYQCKRNTL